MVQWRMRNARNPYLEAPLQADPYDRDAWVVYGDWLQQQDDPRGEYIALRAAWLANPSDGEARSRLEVCDRRYGDYFRGPLTRGELAWSFVDSTELTMWPLEVITAPEARFLTDVSISSPLEGRIDLAVEQMGPHLPVTIRKLHILGRQLTKVAPIAAVLDRVQTLMFRTPIRTDALANCRFPALRDLEFQYVDEDDRSMPRALFGQTLPSLEALSLAHTSIDADLVATIVHAPYAPRLRTLRLFFLDDGAAKVLLDNAGRLRSLTTLQVDDARMSSSMLRALSAIPGFSLGRAGGYDYRD